MKHAYIEKKFRRETYQLIDHANAIIEEFENDGYNLTLRQLYYQFVSKNLLKNSQKSYDKLGRIISDARLAGLVSWSSIEDRTRNLIEVSTWKSPSAILRSAIHSYCTDKWDAQKYRPEVWVEKEALAGVVGQICNELEVPYFACRGYVSQSEIWSAATRLATYYENGQRPIVFHLGDHDPSGMDMTRDNQDRLDMLGQIHIEVVRLALNFDQIEEYKPPPNPAKLTDSRVGDYVKKYGHSSWELDALPPRTIRDLIDKAIWEIKDEDAWNDAVEKQEDERSEMKKAIKHLR